MSIDRDYQISDLNSNSSFYDWFLKENTEIIEKLNLINTFSVLGGDGITAPIASNGIATIGLNGKVDGGISFNGPVFFNNTVAIPNISVRVNQITSTSGGFTFGTPVRVFYDTATNSTKYEACRANDPDQAEVLGVVSDITTSYAYVTLLGQITGDFSTVNKRGIGLTAGWIYFLDPGTTGAITDIEPNQTGQVSKPVIMGVTGNVGMILQMRGNYLNSEGFTGTTGAADRIYINLGSTDILTSSSIDRGTMVSMIYVPGYAADGLQNLGYELYGRVVGSDLPFDYALTASMTDRSIAWSVPPYSGSVDIRNDNCVGIVTDLIDIGSTVFAEISLYGYTDVLGNYPVGTYYLNSSYDSRTNDQLQYTNFQDSHVAFIKYSSNGAIVVNKPSSVGTSGVRSTTASSTYIAANGATGGLNQGTNYLINGNFEVWQRDSIGKNNGYTGTGNVIFADMWRRHDEISGSDATKQYSIIRAEFDEYQDQIEGNPRYYITVQALGLSAIGASGTSGGYLDSDHLMIGHVISGAKKFDLQNLNVKFYGKVSANTYPVDVYFSRYSGVSLINYIKLGTAELNGSWQAFSFNSPITPLTNSGIDIDLDDDYCEIGVDLIPLMELANINGVTLGNSLTVDLSSFVATVGTSVPVALYPNYLEQLNYCREFYFSTYDFDQESTTPTMVDATTPTQNCIEQFIQPNKNCNFLNWPVKMRKVPSVSLYSPYSGLNSDFYNQTANLDGRNTSGTGGYNGAIRNAPLNTPVLSTNISKYGINVCALNGVVLYDTIKYHIIADADFSL